MPTIDPRDRRELFQTLQDTLGSRQADTLMTMLERAEDADLATKKDLDALRIATKADIEGLRAATKADIKELRAATKADMATLEERMHHALEELETRVELRAESREHKILGEIHRSARDVIRTLVVAFTATVISMTAVFMSALMLTR